jgi:hypothetical protein
MRLYALFRCSAGVGLAVGWCRLRGKASGSKDLRLDRGVILGAPSRARGPWRRATVPSAGTAPAWSVSMVRSTKSLAGMGFAPH